jgi:CDP-diglyceride synthetase
MTRNGTRNIKDAYMYILGALVILGFFGVIIYLITVPAPEENKDILLILLGIFGAKFADVVGYFYGSSKGSSDKDELLRK